VFFLKGGWGYLIGLWWQHYREALDFRFGFQSDLAVIDFDRVFHAVTAVLFSDLIGLLLNERGKVLHVSGDFFANVALGFR